MTPARSLRSAENTNVHHVAFNFDEHLLEVFDPIVQELEKRIEGTGSGSLFPHSIRNPSANTKILYFEATSLLNEEMQQLLNQWIMERHNSDGISRKCFRTRQFL